MRLRHLAVAQASALARLEEAWARRRICDDLPGLTAALAARLPAEVKKAVEEMDGAEKQGVFDTHPPDRARIASAEAEAAPGLFRLERPASALVADLRGLSRRATEHHYREVLELKVEPQNLAPLWSFLEEIEDRDQANEAARKVFGHFFSPFHPLLVPLAVPPAPASLADAAAKVDSSAATLARLEQNALAQPARMKPALLPLIAPAGFRDAESAARARLDASLGLIQLAGGEATPTTDRQTIERLLEVLAAVGAQATPLRELVSACDHTIEQVNRHMRDQDDRAAQAAVLEGLRSVYGLLHQLETALLPVPFPFRHGFDRLTVHTYVTNDLPEMEPDNLGLIVRAQQVVQRLSSLYGQVLGKLARITLVLESAHLRTECTRPDPATTQMP